MRPEEICRVPVGVVGSCVIWQGNGEAGITKNATI